MAGGLQGYTDIGVLLCTAHEGREWSRISPPCSLLEPDFILCEKLTYADLAHRMFGMRNGVSLWMYAIELFPSNANQFDSHFHDRHTLRQGGSPFGY